MNQFNRRHWLALASAGAFNLLTPPLSKASTAPLFTEVPASSSGIEFVHESAMSDHRYLPETMGPGAAFLDYDNDGWMDIYFVNSGPCDFWAPTKPISNALYKNNRDGTFTDVTVKAGVSGGIFGMGAAIGDYDNDGWPDIFVTGYCGCILYKNNRDGTFTDVTHKAGLTNTDWTTSAVWFDYDGDGKLDLFVCRFVDYAPGHRSGCGTNKLGKSYYCIPKVFTGTTSFLYHNNGDGTFTEVSKGTPIGSSIGKGLGIVATDINNDGRMDLFVANDTVQNYLYVNRGPGPHGWKWEEIALSAEVGYSENGKARSGMGVDSADLNNTGWEDLFVANVDQEMFSVYSNNHDETFRDTAAFESVAQATRLLSGWGLKYFDYDNDGRMDLILANGHPDDMIAEYSLQVKWHEPLLLFHQAEDGKLHMVSQDDAGPTFAGRFNARGLAIGDYTNTGAPAVLVCLNGGAPILLKNNAAAGNNWLGIKLEGVDCNRDAIGAKIFWTVGGKKYSRLKTSGGSYLSSHDPRLILGIGTATKIDSLEIHWPLPSKRVDRMTNIPINQYMRIVEGKT